MTRPPPSQPVIKNCLPIGREARSNRGRNTKILRFEATGSIRTFVEPRLRHKNQKIMAVGPALVLPIVGERQLRSY
jgi:hypothetical protein